MSRSHSDIKIERTGGPYPMNRYGIKLKPLQKRHRLFLINNRHIRRWSKDDQFIHCVLRMQKVTLNDSTAYKTYFDWHSNAPVDIEGLKEGANTVDWQCAISGKPIKSKFMNFDLENFVHPEYTDVLKAPMVDSRILKSSVDFRHKCKELLLKDREEFLNIAKKSAKKKLP
jgi:hypothetical protein